MSETDLRTWESRVAGWVRVTGEDAADYLQSQFSNDLRREGELLVTYGLFLSLKGKVRADAFVCQDGPESFNVVSYNCAAGELMELLAENVIADEVYFEKQEDIASYVIAGDSHPEVSRGMLAFPGRRMKEPHFDVLLPVGNDETVPEGFRSYGDLESLRIQSGIPSVPMDIGPGDLPQEGGLERDAISFTKGCYLGQEVMARLKSMGHVQRRLFTVGGQGESPIAGMKVLCGGQNVGELRTCCSQPDRWFGLAMLRRKFAEARHQDVWKLESGAGLEIGEPV